jgi:hypothetical protein
VLLGVDTAAGLALEAEPALSLLVLAPMATPDVTTSGARQVVAVQVGEPACEAELTLVTLGACGSGVATGANDVSVASAAPAVESGDGLEASVHAETRPTSSGVTRPSGMRFGFGIPAS